MKKICNKCDYDPVNIFEKIMLGKILKGGEQNDWR